MQVGYSFNFIVIFTILSINDIIVSLRHLCMQRFQYLGQVFICKMLSALTVLLLISQITSYNVSALRRRNTLVRWAFFSISTMCFAFQNSSKGSERRKNKASGPSWPPPFGRNGSMLRRMLKLSYQRFN